MRESPARCGRFGRSDVHVHGSWLNSCGSVTPEFTGCFSPLITGFKSTQTIPQGCVYFCVLWEIFLKRKKI